MTCSPSGSPLCTIPAEVLEHIAYELTCLAPLGPPAALIPLLLTCKTVNNQLSGNSTLYARIFKFKFDDGAVKRRAFVPCPGQYLDQLVLYCTQLQKLRTPVQADDCDELLFGVYLMMLENDGRNAAQLIHAGLKSYLDMFLHTQMWSNTASSHGWPRDNVANACALWLLWMTSTRESLQAETPARREQIIQLVLPYVLVPYRYPSAFTPINHWRIPLNRTVAAHANSVITAHGSYPIYLDPALAWTQIHFSSRPTMMPPLATVAAKLIYFSRREMVPFSIPPHLPLTRADALAAGITRVGPNQEDIHEVNAHLNESLPELGTGWGDDQTLSKRWDSDWWRMRKCFNMWRDPNRRLGPTYEPGTFTGLWQGRMLIPSENHFTDLITTRDYPTDFDENYLGTTTIPIFMRIAEHHSYAPHRTAPCGGTGTGDDDGVVNAYFPPDMRVVETNAQSVTVRVGDEDYEYTTYGAPGAAAAHDADTCVHCCQRAEELRAARARRAAAVHEELFVRAGLGIAPDVDMDDDADVDGDDSEGQDATPPPQDPDRFPPCNGIQDIIFTGTTDTRHGQAWNPFEFYGRIRMWDGMIGILRVPSDPRHGTLFFYGFLVGGQKFVGNWRIAAHDVSMPAYESAFAMARREE